MDKIYRVYQGDTQYDYTVELYVIENNELINVGTEEWEYCDMISSTLPAKYKDYEDVYL